MRAAITATSRHGRVRFLTTSASTTGGHGGDSTSSSSSSSLSPSPVSQAQPLGPYYAAVLAHSQLRPRPLPAPSLSATAKTTRSEARIAPPGDDPSPSPPSPPPISSRSTAAEKARIVFGSRLVGPERVAASASQGTLVCGVLVPPRPTEPDNCCMSGCVDCVWERYREEMDEWVAARVAARAATKRGGAMGKRSERDSAMQVGEVGGIGQKEEEEEKEEALYKDVPVGIREFMKHEKRLKERTAHA